MDNNETGLIQIAQEAELVDTKTQMLMNSFKDSFEEARELAKGAKDIVVTSEDQVEEMKKARTLRLSLKDVRVKVENTRKSLKEGLIREGKAIEGMANIVKALIVPVEEHLERQEKFAELLKETRKRETEKSRHDLLAKYVENADIYSVHPDNLSEDSFRQMLETAKYAFEAKKEALRNEEANRIAKEAAQAAEQERIRSENERLKKEAEEREKQFAAERAAQKEKEDKVAAETARIRAEMAEKARIELEASETKAKKEAEEKANLLKEMEAKREAEAKALKEKEDAEKAARLAPDVEKLKILAKYIRELPLPAVKESSVDILVKRVERDLGSIALFIEKSIKSMEGKQ